MSLLVHAALVAALLLTGCKGLATTGQPEWPIRRMVETTVKVRGSPEHHGSGVIVGARLVLTAAHTVHDSSASVVFANGREISSAVLWRGEGEYDLALLLLAEPAPHAPATLGCRDPSVGEELVGAGFPMRGGWTGAWGRAASPAPYGSDRVHRIVAMPVVPGMSGGPVFDRRGRVVGLMVALMAMPLPGVMGQPVPSATGLGFIVPGETICLGLART